MDAGDTISTLSTDSAITPEQRARLAMKLKLIDQIVRAAEPDMQANNIGLDQKRWLLESLYSAPLEAIQKMGVPGSFAATSAALSRARANTKALGASQSDLVYRPLAPCRYIDTRNVGGVISGSRGYDLASNGASYGGSAGCNPAASAPGGSDDKIGAIAINLTIVSPSNAPGFMGARPAGSTNNTSMVNWYEAGPSVQAANAGIVTTDQSAAGNEIEFFGSPAQIIVDVFGIFTAPAPTALACTTATSTASFLGTVVAGCPAGYTLTGGGCKSNSIYDHAYQTFPSDPATWGCGFWPEAGQTIGTTLTAYAVCCRVPGQ
jgi:hypothetical protein